jgi:hypothetical protein
MPPLQATTLLLTIARLIVNSIGVKCRFGKKSHAMLHDWKVSAGRRLYQPPRSSDKGTDAALEPHTDDYFLHLGMRAALARGRRRPIAAPCPARAASTPRPGRTGADEPVVLGSGTPLVVDHWRDA